MKSGPSKWYICKILRKNKNAYVLDQKYLLWVFLGWGFKKLLSYLKLAVSNLSICKILWKNKKYLNSGPKVPHFGIFGLEF